MAASTHHSTFILEKPPAISAAQSWPGIFTQKSRKVLHGTRKKVQSKLVAIRTTKKLSDLSQKERETASKLPLDLLAREWLNEQRASAEMRYYLVEKLLPTLVLALEKLLMEVTLRDIADCTVELPDFNPINYVAQYLMRNNPRYSNFAEAHPYCRTMKQVSEELKEMAYSIYENRLVEVRVKSRERTSIRKEIEACRIAEENKRKGMLAAVYAQWLVSGENGIVMEEFKQVVESWIKRTPDPEDPIKALYSGLSEIFSDTLKLGWKEPDFVEDIMKCTRDFSAEVFDQLVKHLDLFAKDRRRKASRDYRREKITDAFDKIDKIYQDEMHLLDRFKILYLLGAFYDCLSTSEQETVCNPRQWPLVDVVEVEEMEEDIEKHLSSELISLLSQQDLLDFFEDSEISDFDFDKEVEEGAGEKVAGKESAKEKLVSEEIVKEEKKTVGMVEETETKMKVDNSKGENVETESMKKKEHVRIVEPENSKEKMDEETTLKQKEESLENESVEGQSTKEEDKVDTAASEDSISPRYQFPSSLLERRVATNSESRPQSLSRMRAISGMSSDSSQSDQQDGIWDHEKLSKDQFVQVMELFLGTGPRETLVDSVLQYIVDKYPKESQEERIEALKQIQVQALQRFKIHRIDQVYDAWDNEQSGHVELEELLLSISKWNGFDTGEVMDQAMKAVLESADDKLTRFNRFQFHTYMKELTEDMIPEELAKFFDYLLECAKPTLEKQHRGNSRRKTLETFVQVAKTKEFQFTTAMKLAVSIIQQDVKRFGDGKELSVTISMLERCQERPDPVCLCIKAASQAQVISSKLFRSDTEGVSFTTVDTARSVHVEKIQEHGGIHFYIPEHKTPEYDGSLVVVPIINPHQTVLGTISVDTLQSTTDHSAFQPHEISFYEGLGIKLGQIHHWITVIQQQLKVARSALCWLHRHCPSLVKGEVYLIQSAGGGAEEREEQKLRLMLSTTPSGPSVENIHQEIQCKDDPFHKYLFDSMETSGALSTEVHGQRHLVYPIRDHNGYAVLLVDLTMSSSNNLEPRQLREVTKALKILTTAFYHLSSGKVRVPRLEEEESLKQRRERRSRSREGREEEAKEKEEEEARKREPQEAKKSEDKERRKSEEKEEGMTRKESGEIAKEKGMEKEETAGEKPEKEMEEEPKVKEMAEDVQEKPVIEVGETTAEKNKKAAGKAEVEGKGMEEQPVGEAREVAEDKTKIEAVGEVFAKGTKEQPVGEMEEEVSVRDGEEKPMERTSEMTGEEKKKKVAVGEARMEGKPAEGETAEEMVKDTEKMPVEMSGDLAMEARGKAIGRDTMKEEKETAIEETKMKGMPEEKAEKAGEVADQMAEEMAGEKKVAMKKERDTEKEVGKGEEKPEMAMGEEVGEAAERKEKKEPTKKGEREPGEEAEKEKEGGEKEAEETAAMKEEEDVQIAEKEPAKKGEREPGEEAEKEKDGGEKEAEETAAMKEEEDVQIAAKKKAGEAVMKGEPGEAAEVAEREPGEAIKEEEKEADETAAKKAGEPRKVAGEPGEAAEVAEREPGEAIKKEEKEADETAAKEAGEPTEEEEKEPGEAKKDEREPWEATKKEGREPEEGEGIGEATGRKSEEDIKKKEGELTEEGVKIEGRESGAAVNKKGEEAGETAAKSEDKVDGEAAEKKIGEAARTREPGEAAEKEEKEAGEAAEKQKEVVEAAKKGKKAGEAEKKEAGKEEGEKEDEEGAKKEAKTKQAKGKGKRKKQSGGGDPVLPVLFDKLMLDDVNDKIDKLNIKVFAELRKYEDPLPVVIRVVRAFLYLLHPESLAEEFSTWTQCKGYITSTMIRKIKSYNPLEVKVHPHLDLIKDLISVSEDELAREGDITTKYIYLWVRACVPLLEHSTSPTGSRSPTPVMHSLSSSKYLPSMTSPSPSFQLYGSGARFYLASNEALGSESHTSFNASPPPPNTAKSPDE